MTITLDLPSTLADALRQRAAAKGQDLASCVREVVAESLIDEAPSAQPARSTRDFSRRLHAWIARHPVLDHAVDDSRESIYAGRGE